MAGSSLGLESIQGEAAVATVLKGDRWAGCSYSWGAAPSPTLGADCSRVTWGLSTCAFSTSHPSPVWLPTHVCFQWEGTQGGSCLDQSPVPPHHAWKLRRYDCCLTSGASKESAEGHQVTWTLGWVAAVKSRKTVNYGRLLFTAFPAFLLLWDFEVHYMICRSAYRVEVPVWTFWLLKLHYFLLLVNWLSVVKFRLWIFWLSEASHCKDLISVKTRGQIQGPGSYNRSCTQRPMEHTGLLVTRKHWCV